MKKVVAYGAYNNENEVEEFKKRVNSEIAKNKEWELKKVYIDYGANKKYEALTTLLNEIFDEKKDIILIKNVKQFIKVIQGMEFIIRYLEKEKVEIRFLDENLSTLDIVGKMQVTIMLSMDKYERERKAENVKHCKMLKKERFEEIQAVIAYKNKTGDFKNATLEEQRKMLAEKLKNNPNYKMYEYVDGESVFNEKEVDRIKQKIDEDMENIKKIELKEKVNQSRSEKMKEWWENKADREMMSAKMKRGKEFKKRER